MSFIKPGSIQEQHDRVRAANGLAAQASTAVTEAEQKLIEARHALSIAHKEHSNERARLAELKHIEGGFCAALIRRGEQYFRHEDPCSKKARAGSRFCGTHKGYEQP